MSGAMGSPGQALMSGGLSPLLMSALQQHGGGGGMFGGMFGGGSPMTGGAQMPGQPRPAINPFPPMMSSGTRTPGQYQASPGAQSQIQSLLSGNAGPGAGGRGAGANPLNTTFGKYTGALTPGIQAAMKAGGSGVPGGGGGFGLPETGLLGLSLLPSIFGAGNNSQIQDIAGALYQGKPLTDANWANAGFGPGGIALGG